MTYVLQAHNENFWNSFDGLFQDAVISSDM
jgi:hypothetical protein